jgi:hypothetical protein
VLRIDRVKEIHARIPSVHLVMHGSSSVPEDWLAIINSYGGDMGQTYGVPVSEIVEGIKNGVRKVNIDTDLRMASTGSIRKHLAENKSNFDPRKFLKEATKAMSGICAARYEAFGAAGMASKITKVYNLEDMQKRYDKGELDPQGQLINELVRHWLFLALWPVARRLATGCFFFGSSYEQPLRNIDQSLPLMHKGKVRDIYAIDDQRMLIVTTDRLSAFDVVLPTPIPGKGQVLTAVADFWFANWRTSCRTS